VIPSSLSSEFLQSGALHISHLAAPFSSSKVQAEHVIFSLSTGRETCGVIGGADVAGTAIGAAAVLGGTTGAEGTVTGGREAAVVARDFCSWKIGKSSRAAGTAVIAAGVLGGSS
jgi:hypothetical protein